MHKAEPYATGLLENRRGARRNQWTAVQMNADEWGEPLCRDIREETHLRFDDSSFPSAPSTAWFRVVPAVPVNGPSSRVLLVVRMRTTVPLVVMALCTVPAVVRAARSGPSR